MSFASGDVVDILLRLSGLQAFVAGSQEASASIKEIGDSAVSSSAKSRTAGSRMGGVAGLAAKAWKTSAVAVAAFALESTKMAVSFDAEMERVHTQAGATQLEVSKMSKAILEMSASGMYAQGPQTLAEGLYHLESIGLRGSRALAALKIAANGAAVGNASLEDTTTALGSAWLAQIKGAGDLNHVMALMNATVGAGNMRMQDLVSSLGTGVLPAAKLAHLGITDVFGALAVLSDEGWQGSSAMAQFATSLHFLTDPTKKAQKALAEMGLSTFQLANTMRTRGLPAALELLKSRLDKFGTARQGQLLGDILPAGRGRVLEVLLNQVTRYEGKIRQVNRTSGQFGEDVARTHQTAAFKIHAAWAQIQADMIRIGHVLEPIFVTGAHVVALVIHQLVLFTPTLIHILPYLAPLAAGFLAWKLAIVAVAVASKAAAIAQIVWTILLPVLTGDTLGMAAAWAALTAAMEINPFVLVVTALVVLGVAIVLAYKKFGWFRNAVHAVWSWLKTATSDTIGAVVTAFHWMSRAAGDVAGFIQKHWRIIIFFVLGPLGLAIDFVTKHWQWFATAGKAAWRVIASVASWAWAKVIHPVFNWIAGAAKWTVGAIGDVFKFVGKIIAAPFQWAWNNVIKPVANWIVGAFHWVGAEISKVWHKIMGPISKVTGALGAAGHWGGNALSNVGNFLGLQGGGMVTSPGAVWVGEHGPELLNLPRGASVSPLNTVGRPATGALGGNVTIVVPVSIDRREVARATGKFVDDRLARQ